jgi:hypothetical protein
MINTDLNDEIIRLKTIILNIGHSNSCKSRLCKQCGYSIKRCSVFVPQYCTCYLLEFDKEPVKPRTTPNHHFSGDSYPSYPWSSCFVCGNEREHPIHH